jgi:hypothetical protein
MSTRKSSFLYFFVLYYKKNKKHFSVEIGKTRKLETRASCFHTISRFPNLHSCWYNCIYQHGKCFIFVKHLILYTSTDSVRNKLLVALGQIFRRGHKFRLTAETLFPRQMVYSNQRCFRSKRLRKQNMLTIWELFSFFINIIYFHFQVRQATVKYSLKERKVFTLDYPNVSLYLLFLFIYF